MDKMVLMAPYTGRRGSRVAMVTKSVGVWWTYYAEEADQNSSFDVEVRRGACRSDVVLVILQFLKVTRFVAKSLRVAE
ncbi:hypothetical protein TNCV_308931 [Trichonephila clavipes]|nr:hypothetical protein TNCV_308931 [Trichonephila clavipes]